MRFAAEIDGVKVVSTAELCKMLGFQVSSTLLMKIGNKPMVVLSRGIFWREDSIEDIKKSLCELITKGADKFPDVFKKKESHYGN